MFSQVDLVAEQASLPARGGVVTVGLRIEPDPGWHAYWANPGDAGLPPTMEWKLPAGYSTSGFRFPAPHVIPFGELITYGFDEPILLLSDVSVPSGLAAGAFVELGGLARWVVCDDELCVPEKASLSVTLAVGDGSPDPRQAERFAAARAKLPEAADWPARFERLGDEVRVTVEAPGAAGRMQDAYLYVASHHLVEYAYQTAAATPAGLVFTMDAGRRADAAGEFAAVLSYGNGTGAGRSVSLHVQQAGETVRLAAGGAMPSAGLAGSGGPPSVGPAGSGAMPSAGPAGSGAMPSAGPAGSGAMPSAGPAGSGAMPSAGPAGSGAMPSAGPAGSGAMPSAGLAGSGGPPSAGPAGSGAMLSAELAGSDAAPSAGLPVTGMSLATALLFAFVGGVILNLMPCVFPILSIKALSLVTAAHTSRLLARQSGLLYTAGILVAFGLIGGILVGLREAGQAAGWGFQLQSPLVNLGLALLMLAIALNLLGVFELGTRAAGFGQSLTAGGERKAAFFTGLLAVLVATPCTAPFMAGALGYALVQSAPVAIGIFIALGFGLAFPYLLVSFVPAFGRIMPRPGAWMARFRSILAFPMFATAVWLFWVLGKQLGVNSMAVGLLAALSFAFALWAYGQSAGNARPWAWRLPAAAGLIAALATGANIEEYRTDPEMRADGHAGTLGLLELERFTPERVAEYVDSGQPVFLYFTADWCVNCKLNERVALASDEVGMAFRKRGIKVVEGDWTNEDPTISEWLNRYGRAGVPLYLYFSAGSTLSGATVLPQILVPDIVIDAIETADRSTAWPD